MRPLFHEEYDRRKSKNFFSRKMKKKSSDVTKLVDLLWRAGCIPNIVFFCFCNKVANIRVARSKKIFGLIASCVIFSILPKSFKKAKWETCKNTRAYFLNIYFTILHTVTVFLLSLLSLRWHFLQLFHPLRFSVSHGILETYHKILVLVWSLYHDWKSYRIHLQLKTSRFQWNRSKITEKPMFNTSYVL